MYVLSDAHVAPTHIATCISRSVSAYVLYSCRASDNRGCDPASFTCTFCTHWSGMNSLCVVHVRLYTDLYTCIFMKKGNRLLPWDLRPSACDASTSPLSYGNLWCNCGYVQCTVGTHIALDKQCAKWANIESDLNDNWWQNMHLEWLLTHLYAQSY